MHPADIQAALKKKGITQKEIAQELNVCPMSVSLVINKRSVSDRTMRAVAEKIGKDPLDVFSDYYFSAAKGRKAA